MRWLPSVTATNSVGTNTSPSTSLCAELEPLLPPLRSSSTFPSRGSDLPHCNVSCAWSSDPPTHHEAPLKPQALRGFAVGEDLSQSPPRPAWGQLTCEEQQPAGPQQRSETARHHLPREKAGKCRAPDPAPQPPCCNGNRSGCTVLGDWISDAHKCRGCSRPCHLQPRSSPASRSSPSLLPGHPSSSGCRPLPALRAGSTGGQSCQLTSRVILLPGQGVGGVPKGQPNRGRAAPQQQPRCEKRGAGLSGQRREKNLLPGEVCCSSFCCQLNFKGTAGSCPCPQARGSIPVPSSQLTPPPSCPREEPSSQRLNSSSSLVPAVPRGSGGLQNTCPTAGGILLHQWLGPSPPQERPYCKEHFLGSEQLLGTKPHVPD